MYPQEVFFPLLYKEHCSVHIEVQQPIEEPIRQQRDNSDFHTRRAMRRLGSTSRRSLHFRARDNAGTPFLIVPIIAGWVAAQWRIALSQKKTPLNFNFVIIMCALKFCI